MANSDLPLKLIFAAALWHGVCTAQAGDLPGADDPTLLAAIDVWLADNDADSLPAMAALAGDGNTAARLLLARIEATEQAPSIFVSSLSRKERGDLFRSDSGKGLFRPSWLKSEQQAGNQFAAALLDSSALEVNLGAIRTLYELGEDEAAYDLIREVAANGSQQQKDELAAFLPAKSELAPYIRALQKPVAGLTPGHAALQQMVGGDQGQQPGGTFPRPEGDTNAAATFVEFGYQTGVQNTDFDLANSYYNHLANWIGTAPATAPIANLCRRVCNDADVGPCAITAFGLAGGYYKVIRFDSPLQALIDQSRYAASDRATGMVLRRIAFAKTAAGTSMIFDSYLSGKSLCLAKVVAEIRAAEN